MEGSIARRIKLIRILVSHSCATAASIPAGNSSTPSRTPSQSLSDLPLRLSVLRGVELAQERRILYTALSREEWVMSGAVCPNISVLQSPHE